MVTLIPIDHQQSLFSMVDQNGQMHHCIPYSKEKDKKGNNQTQISHCFACKHNEAVMKPHVLPVLQKVVLYSERKTRQMLLL
jgi:hypothetical protein